MAIDAALKAFLDLSDDDVAAYAEARAAEVGLSLPASTLPGVGENLALLRVQTALFVAALSVGVEGERAGQTAETFAP